MGTAEETESGFAARMLAEQKRRRWTLEDLAAHVAEHGVRLHKSAFAKMQLGTRGVSLGEAKAIADAFGLPLGSLTVTADAAEIEAELSKVTQQLAEAAAASDDALADVAAAINRQRELTVALLTARGQEDEHGAR